MSSVSIRVLESAEWRTYRDLRLSALADTPDAFGSTLARESAHSGEWWSARLSEGAASDWDLPLVAEVGGRPVGLAWGRIEPSNPDTARLYQMWVAPDSRGFGAGRRLLDAAITWARSRDARSMELGVSCGETPAARLYARAGFTPAGAPEPLRPGSAIFVQPMKLELHPLPERDRSTECEGHRR